MAKYQQLDLQRTSIYADYSTVTTACCCKVMSSSRTPEEETRWKMTATVPDATLD